MLEFIVPALQNLLNIQNLLWINLGVFIGSVFAAIPGLTVILCIILFLPFTYQMTAIPGMMFLLGIYCAGGYGGSVSAILINTPGTPHAAPTMLDGYPLNQQGRTKATLKITHKQFKRIKDEYEYYISMGGNHDVKERFEDFLAKIYGTGEIRMVPDDAVKH